jgi:large subunit ribosomal protein L18
MKRIIRTTPKDRRTNRVRKAIKGVHPRLSVYRSNRFIRAQIIDDAQGVTLASASSEKENLRGKSAAEAVGKKIAAEGKKAGVTKVVFDRGGYSYEGNIKALADAAREGGLEF